MQPLRLVSLNVERSNHLERVLTFLKASDADNIPPQYPTSIDVTLHKRGRERPHEFADKMVDGLFTTPGYRARDVELHFGISDHAAVTALIERV